MKHLTWKTVRSYALVTGLACVMGVSYELFVFPNAFAPAGINGLATMLQYLLHINIGYLSLLINLPLVLLAWRKVDPDFARKTLVFVLTFSAVTLLLGRMDLSGIAYDSGSSENRLLDRLCYSCRCHELPVSTYIEGVIRRHTQCLPLRKGSHRSCG